MDIEEVYQKIYSFCYFKVKNGQLAEDLTQETFLKYFNTTDYLEKGKQLAFLYTIARNCCNDYFRKTKHLPLNQDDLPDNAVDITASLEASMGVNTAVSRLSDAEQELVLLRFVNELSIGEISAYQGISRFALYRRLKAVEKKLKQFLIQEGYYES